MMKYRFLLIYLAACAAWACGSGVGQSRPAATAPTAPVQYDTRVVAVYPHATDAYTQGLQFVDGVLWEGTGQHGRSVLQRIDLETGRANVVARLPRSEFGEGITVLGDRIYQLTWQSNTAYVYDRRTGEQLRTFRYSGEGWGLTTDGEKLYLSDGTSSIYRIDPATFRREGKITVTVRGEAVPYLNELEWINGRIWANVYMSDYILIINPQTGVTEGLLHLTDLLPESDRTPETDVLNGIAYDAEQNRIFVTGKNWPKLFEIELIEP